MSKKPNFAYRCTIVLATLACLMLMVMASPAVAAITLERIDFDGLVHGQIVHRKDAGGKSLHIQGAKVKSDGTNDVAGSGHNGVTISGKNLNDDYKGNRDWIVAFDTYETYTRDGDLEDPFDGGNAADHTIEINNVDTLIHPDLVGNTQQTNYDSTASRFNSALIIQEHNVGKDKYPKDHIVDERYNVAKADDEGARPSGSIFFEFDSPITSIGFDLLDVEGDTEIGLDENSDSYDPNNLPTPGNGTQTTSGYVGFFGEDGDEIARVGFNEFTGSDGAFSNLNNDPNRPGSDNPGNVVYGNNHANRIDEITIEELEDFIDSDISSAFKKIEFNFGGSGAVDNLVYQSFKPTGQVPEATSLLIWAMLGLTVGGYNRRMLFA